jgi:aconitate hydratase
MEGPVLIKVENNISTDEIMPAGGRVLPFRSNIPEISKFTFYQIDEEYYTKALPYQKTGHFIVAGLNYGQGSSREHAAMAPRYLGVKAVLAKSYARIHWQNLVNFGVLPLSFADKNDYAKISPGDHLSISNVREVILSGQPIKVENKTKKEVYLTTHALSARQIQTLLHGGIINEHRKNN